MSNNKINKVIDLYTELIMEQGNDSLKNIIASSDFKTKLLAASGQKKLKKSKDPNAPKKPTTAWLLFCNETRPILKEENPTMKMSEITSLMSPMWVELQESTKPEDIEKVENYKKIVAQEREAYTSAKSEEVKKKPEKKPRSAYLLFMKDERKKPKPEGETFGDTTRRIGVLWKQLKETDPEKVDEYNNRVKNWGSASEQEATSASEAETETEVEAEAEVQSDEAEETEKSIEAILAKMHDEEEPTVVEEPKPAPKKQRRPRVKKAGAGKSS